MAKVKKLMSCSAVKTWRDTTASIVKANEFVELQAYYSRNDFSCKLIVLDETRVLVGWNERTYKDKYMWGIRANSVNLSYFIYEDGTRGAKAIRPFLD